MKPFLVAMLSLVVTACSGGDGIIVIDAWARPTPPVADTGAFYVTLQNGGGTTALVGARSDACGSVALHDTTLEGGIMQMRPIEVVEIDRGERLEMSPAGLHVMCISMTGPLVEGETVGLTLEMKDGDLVDLVVSVEDR